MTWQLASEWLETLSALCPAQTDYILPTLSTLTPYFSFTKFAAQKLSAWGKRKLRNFSSYLEADRNARLKTTYTKNIDSQLIFTRKDSQFRWMNRERSSWTNSFERFVQNTHGTKKFPQKQDKAKAHCSPDDKEITVAGFVQKAVYFQVKVQTKKSTEWGRQLLSERKRELYINDCFQLFGKKTFLPSRSKVSRSSVRGTGVTSLFRVENEERTCVCKILRFPDPSTRPLSTVETCSDASLLHVFTRLTVVPRTRTTQAGREPPFCRFIPRYSQRIPQRNIANKS